MRLRSRHAQESVSHVGRKVMKIRIITAYEYTKFNAYLSYGHIAEHDHLTVSKAGTKCVTMFTQGQKTIVSKSTSSCLIKI
jgi:hypothetical protein